MRRSSPATSWKGESVLEAVSLKRAYSKPDMVLKSQFRRDILCLSLGLLEAAFFGFDPNTILLVL